MSHTMDADTFDCQPITAQRKIETGRDHSPLMTPARRAALDALERELSEFLKACRT